MYILIYPTFSRHRKVSGTVPAVMGPPARFELVTFLLNTVVVVVLAAGRNRILPGVKMKRCKSCKVLFGQGLIILNTKRCATRTVEQTIMPVLNL